MKRKILLLLLLAAALSFRAAAEENSILRSLPPEAARFWQELPDADARKMPELRSIVRTALEKAGDTVRPAMQTAAALCAVGTVLAALAAGKIGSFGVTACTAAAVTALCTGGIRSCFSVCRGVIEELSVFQSALIPVMATAAASSGAPESSAALYAVTVTVGGLLTRFLSEVAAPVAAAYLALATANGVFGDGMLSGAVKLTEKTETHLLKAASFAFTAYLALTRVLHGSADALSVKAMKLTVSGSVPLVGSMLADASETVLAAAHASLLTAGRLGLLGLCAVLIVPFLRIAVWHLCLLLAAGACELLGAFSAAKQIGAAAKTLSFLMGIAAAAGLFSFVSCVCFLRVSI